ncbi:MAG: SpoVR family protein, partial [Rhodospirillales bacterium]|nr:SpoVR family protein [Rhodospirillales bacterium]
LCDDEKDSHYTITNIHDERGYKIIRETLARSYDIGLVEPNIQVTDVDLLGERHLKLQHTMHDRIPLAEKNRTAVLEQVHKLWGYDVSLVGVDSETDEVCYQTGTGKSEA